ncbi:MAG: flagellar export protein FliJ [Deltaproteobacteria bacterium]|nr:flagellar export protein FliJ [Deltaproteobacteria bacterium]
MPAFRFRLAAVLRSRERSREEKRLELAAVEEAKARLTTEIRTLETLIAAQGEELAERRERMLTGADLRLRGEFAQQAARKIQEQRALLATVQQKLEEKRAEVLQADREVKSLEQLRVRLQARHRREARAEEQKLADEVGQRRYLDRER